jgi:uncharacterized membrane protein
VGFVHLVKGRRRARVVHFGRSQSHLTRPPTPNKRTRSALGTARSGGNQDLGMTASRLGGWQRSVVVGGASGGGGFGGWWMVVDGGGGGSWWR